MERLKVSIGKRKTQMLMLVLAKEIPGDGQHADGLGDGFRHRKAGV